MNKEDIQAILGLHSIVALVHRVTSLLRYKGHRLHIQCSCSRTYTTDTQVIIKIYHYNDIAIYNNNITHLISNDDQNESYADR